jgi:ribosomal protein S18 acetylase RimI-like enzyme
METLMKSLLTEPLRNAGNISALINTTDIVCYASQPLRAVVGVSNDEKRVVLAGYWEEMSLPLEVFPKQEFFISGCLPEAMDLIRKEFKVKEEWPCWYYLAPVRYESGPWDELGPLTLDDVDFVSKYWHLSDDPVRHLREKLAKYDSACVRRGGKPVSWTGLHYEVGGYANLGFGHTLEEHRRKGYASMVTKALVNRLAARGLRATCHVIKDNANSIRLCESLGFEVVGEATWAVLSHDK